jgi:hypothetical protein
MKTSRFAAILFLSSACIGPFVCAGQIPAQVASVPRSAPELIQLAKEVSPDLRQAIMDTFSQKDLESGTAWSGHLHDFFFAIRASSRPTLIIDDLPGPTMESFPSNDLWYAAAQIDRLGALHSFRYQIDGKDFGGSLNVPAFTELS